MKRGIRVILGTFKHLPSGAGEAAFEGLYEREIKPFLAALYQFPRVALSIHYSGALLNWLERRRHEVILLLQSLIDRKQVELLGGGFYEPMFPLLTQTDKIGQIEMLTTYLRKQFGKRAQGCWIPALAWEQNMVDPLDACGMGYCFLDDAQFAAAGARIAYGHFYAPSVTEDLGKTLTVFPLSAWLAKELRQGKASRAMERLAASLDAPPRQGQEEAGLADGAQLVSVFPRGLFFEEGEGVEAGYLRVFEGLSRADERVEFTTPGRVFKTLRRLPRLYFPPTWDSGAPGGEIVHGSRQFLSDSPEASGIYARTMHTHLLINQIRGDKSRKRTALEELWKAQDCEIFRPKRGLSGQPVLKAAFRSLLEAEKIAREKAFKPSLAVFDINLDGEAEYLFQDDKVNCYVSPEGAGVFELDYLKRPWNYLAPFAPPRRDKGEAVPLEERSPCSCFSDFLLPVPASPERLEGPGRFCGGEIFEEVSADRAKKNVRFRLPRREGAPFGEVEVEKTCAMQKSVFSAAYSLRNGGDVPREFAFVPRLFLSFPGEGEEFLSILTAREGEREPLEAAGEGRLRAAGVKTLLFKDMKNEVIITLEANEVFDAAVVPVRSAPDGECVAVCVLPVFPVSLPPSASWDAKLTLKFSP